MARDPVIEQLLLMLDRAYDRRSWHGTNLRGSIRGLSASAAAWRPGAARHNVWEIVVHAAYWKYAVWRRLAGAKRGTFPLEGSNWFERPVAATEAAWREDVRLLERMHRQLRDEVARLSARRLNERPRGNTVTFSELVTGIAAHDLYHAGQIQLVKRLAS